MNIMLLRLLVLAAAALQIMTPVFVNPFRDGARPVSTGAPSQIEPSGYAFAIWGLIYLGAAGYAIWQLTPVGRADPISARIAPLALALYTGSTLWLLAAQSGPLWATIPILATMAACACTVLISVVAAPGASTFRWWAVVLPFGLYAGWIVCATFVNIAEVAPGYGFNRFGLSVSAYAVVSLGAAALVAVGVLLLANGNPVFAATVVWALIAIVVAARQRGVPDIVQVAAFAGIVAVAAISAWFQFRGRTQ
jgi:hypothetical protein